MMIFPQTIMTHRDFCDKSFLLSPICRIHCLTNDYTDVQYQQIVRFIFYNFVGQHSAPLALPYNIIYRILIRL